MAKGKSSSPSNKAHYTRYKAEDTRHKNKLRAVARTLKVQPNNEQLKNYYSNLQKNKATFRKEPVNKNYNLKPKQTQIGDLYAKFTDKRLAEHFRALEVREQEVLRGLSAIHRR